MTGKEALARFHTLLHLLATPLSHSLAPTRNPFPSGTLISKTEVASFIQRDDFMDQIYRWAIIEAGESGIRNFGLPMNVEPFYNTTMPIDPMLWGFKVSIFKEGTHLCDLGIMFDQVRGGCCGWAWVGPIACACRPALRRSFAAAEQCKNMASP